MNILTYDNAKHRLGYSNYQKGYLLLWTNADYKHGMTYEHIVSWHVYTKQQCIDIINLVCIMAYVNTLEFKYTRNNTTITLWEERGYCQLILWYDDTALLELNDESVYELIEDGFLNPKDFHGSMLSFYNQE